MKYLLAPWRWSFISSAPENNGCVFCAALNNPSEPLVVFRGRDFFVILNKYPYSSGHLMVVPRQHTCDINSIGAAQIGEMWDLVKRAVNILKKCFSPAGFNIGMNLGENAGAGIADHMHVHVVPRWAGDANFMAVTAGTRVVSYDLAQMAELLRKEFSL